MTTLFHEQTKEEIAHLLAEVYAEVPRHLTELSRGDVNRLAAEWDERFSEARIHRNTRPQRHE